METRKNRVLQVLVVSLTAVYLFIALTYVQFLPNYRTLKLSGHAQWHTGHTARLLQPVDYTGTQSRTMLQLFFKSTPEHKKGYALLWLQVAVALTSVLAALNVTRFLVTKGRLGAYAGSQRYAYLHLRSLRI